MQDEIEELRKKAIAELEKPLAPAPLEKNTFSFKEMSKIKEITQKFLIPELLPNNALAVLIGEDGIGKTQILTQLCLSISLGRTDFLSLQLNTLHKRCLIVATEDSKEKFAKALFKQADAMEPGHDADKINLDFTEASNFEDLNALKAELETLLKLNSYDLIVVDALSDAFTMIDGEINSNSHARKILGMFQSIINTYSTSIIFVHHASKSKIVAKLKEGKMFVEKGDSQGAGAITQKPRTIWALTHDPRSIKNEGTTYTNYLHVVKANLMSKHFVTNAIELEFDATHLLHSALGLVDIQVLENQDPEANLAPNRKPMAKELSQEKHKENVELAFFTSPSLSRAELVDKLRQIYGVGKNKIEAKDGYLNYLIERGIVVNGNGLYRKGGESDEVVRMPISSEFEAPNLANLDLTEQDEEDPPF